MGQIRCFPSDDASGTENHRKGSKKGRTKKSRKKGAEMERPMDQEEEESALTLMQMSEAPIQHSRTPYYGDDHGISTQLSPKNPLMRPSSEPSRKSNRRKTGDKRSIKKRGRSDLFEPSSDEEDLLNGAGQYPNVSSTPSGEIDRSLQLSYHPSVSPVNALDDVPTDEDVAAYENYAKDTVSADRSGLPDRDIFTFPQQQLSDPFDQDEAEDCMQGRPQSSTDVYALLQRHEKPNTKKRKRRTDHQENFALEQGQHDPHSDLEAFDDFLQASMSSADLSHIFQVDSIPIDPELHIIDALAPSADLSNLTDEDISSLQKDGTAFGRHGSSQPRKRRRLEELQGANISDLPWMSPYSFQHDQENIKNQALPGYEDIQRQPSLRLGSPFSDNADDRDPFFSGAGAQVKKSIRRDSKDGRKIARSKDEREGSEKDEKVDCKEGGKADKFSAVEGVKLDHFRDNYCEANAITAKQFNNLIQTRMRGNAQVTGLFDEIYDILPSRSRLSVQKFCRRRFHNFQRGGWSAEDDQMLKDVVAEKGKAWKEIGESLGRMADDCRDRWRNYLGSAEHRNRERWTDAEVINLCTAILECWQLLKEERMQAREDGEDQPTLLTESGQELEDMKHINWQSVSDRMGQHGGGRSRLQCSFKWGQLKKREQADYLKAIRESREIEMKRTAPAKNPWRMKLASKKVANMKPGDQYALLQAVTNSNVVDEGNLPWKSLGDTDFRATWTVTDKKVAWSNLKETVLGYELMDYHSIANELLSRLKTLYKDEIDEKWNPGLHGDVSEKKNGKKRKYTRRSNKGKAKEGIDAMYPFPQRNIDFMNINGDTDAQVEDPTSLQAFEPQDYNRYNALSIPDDNMDAAGMNTSNGLEPINADGGEEDIYADQRNTNGHHQSSDNREVSPWLAHRVSMLNRF